MIRFIILKFGYAEDASNECSIFEFVGEKNNKVFPSTPLEAISSLANGFLGIYNEEYKHSSRSFDIWTYRDWLISVNTGVVDNSRVNDDVQIGPWRLWPRIADVLSAKPECFAVVEESAEDILILTTSPELADSMSANRDGSQFRAWRERCIKDAIKYRFNGAETSYADIMADRLNDWKDVRR